ISPRFATNTFLNILTPRIILILLLGNTSFIIHFLENKDKGEAGRGRGGRVAGEEIWPIPNLKRWIVHCGWWTVGKGRGLSIL
ncbi:MAG: hypothetical protein DRJ14_05505, partial [Acidobacteria bacterium]